MKIRPRHYGSACHGTKRHVMIQEVGGNHHVLDARFLCVTRRACVCLIMCVCLFDCSFVTVCTFFLGDLDNFHTFPCMYDYVGCMMMSS